jgi:hypothetical protein
MGNHESEDNVWSLVNHDLSIARKGLERAMEGAKAAGSRMAADNAELERLRGILAGRSVPPTAAEVAAHYAAGGKWRVVEHQCERKSNGRTHTRPACERSLSEPEHINAYQWEARDWGLTTTWWALDKGYLLTTWPQAEAPAAVVPEPPAAEPEIIGSGRIEPVGIPGLILAGLPEEFVAADDRWLTTRQGHRYARKDGIDVSAEYRITPSDLAKINAKLNDRPSYAVEALMAFEESMGRP